MKFLDKVSRFRHACVDNTTEATQSLDAIEMKKPRGRISQLFRWKHIESGIKERKESGSKVDGLSSISYFQVLPTEILQLISQYVDIETALVLGTTCRRVRLIVIQCLDDVVLREIQKRSLMDIDRFQRIIDDCTHLPSAGRQAQVKLCNLKKWDLKLVFWLVYLKVEKSHYNIELSRILKCDQKIFRSACRLARFRVYPYEERRKIFRAQCNVLRSMRYFVSDTLVSILKETMKRYQKPSARVCTCPFNPFYCWLHMDHHYEKMIRE